MAVQGGDVTLTVYISGGMSDYPNYNYEAFYAAEEVLKKRGYRVLNPAKIGLLMDYDAYSPINKAMLDGADAIYLLQGWENSSGACAELDYAESLGLLVIHQGGDIEKRWWF